MSATEVYELLGLRVRSPLALGEPVLSGGRVDVEVTIDAPRDVPDGVPPGQVVCELADDGRRYYTAARTETGYVIRYFGTCDFELSMDHRSIRCVPHPGLDLAYLPVLLSGGVITLLLLLDGVCVLHASAVTAGDAAIALVGGSGMGKSTLAARLCLAGAALVADDVLRVDFADDGTVSAVGGVPELRLRDGAVSLATRFELPAAARTTADGRTAVRPARCVDGPVGLDAIVLPRPSRAATGVRVQQIGAADAVLRLAEHPRLYGGRDPEMLRASFGHTAELVRRVAVYDAELPWGTTDPDGVARDLARAVGVPLPVGR